MSLVRLIAGSLTFAMACWSLTALPDPPASPVWYGDYGKALADARQSGRPIFVVFT